MSPNVPVAAIEANNGFSQQQPFGEAKTDIASGTAG
jgi:hypothetical protein